MSVNDMKMTKQISEDLKQLNAFTKNPGLQQIAQDIFQYLDQKSIANCRLVNNSWKGIIDQPFFLLKKLRAENHDDQEILKSWKMLAREIKDDQCLEQDFVLILSKMFKLRPIQPLKVVDKLRKSQKYPKMIKCILENVDANSTVDLYILRDFFEEEDEKTQKSFTPIHIAALYGLTETVGKLAKKFDSPSMVKNEFGWTPIHFAAIGDIEVLGRLNR